MGQCDELSEIFEGDRNGGEWGLKNSVINIFFPQIAMLTADRVGKIDEKADMIESRGNYVRRDPLRRSRGVGDEVVG